MRASTSAGRVATSLISAPYRRYQGIVDAAWKLTAYGVEGLGAFVLLQVDQVLAVLVDGGNVGGNGLVLVEYTISGGEDAPLAQRDGCAPCGRRLGRRCRGDRESEGKSKKESGLVEHRE